jgi:hypothetical protein
LAAASWASLAAAALAASLSTFLIYAEAESPDALKAAALEARSLAICAALAAATA